MSGWRFRARRGGRRRRVAPVSAEGASRAGVRPLAVGGLGEVVAELLEGVDLREAGFVDAEGIDR